MRKITFLLLLASCVLLASVSYQFKGSKLFILGLDAYDEVEIEIEGKKSVLRTSELVIPWRKNYNTTLVLTPIKDNVRGEKVRLYIDASKDRPPSVRLKVPSYVPLGKLVLDLSVEDDWDEPQMLRFSVYLDGVRIDPPKDNKLVLDTFFMHSGERRLRIVCRDSGSNVVDQTYRFVVTPLPPAPPQLGQGKILSSRVHRIYVVQDGTIQTYETRSNELKELFAFVCDLDAAGNESFPALHVGETNLAEFQSPIVMNLNSSCSLSSEHSVFGKVVVPADQTVVVRAGSTLRLNAGCELLVRGTLVLQGGSKLIGPGSLSVVDSGRLIVTGGTIETNVSIDGATTVWFSDVDLSKTNLRIGRSLLFAMKNVRADRLNLENTRKIWIDSSNFKALEISSCHDVMILNSKMSQLNVFQNSRVRMRSCSVTSTRTAISVSDLSILEIVDSWVSGKTGVSVDNFSIFRVRSSQINADTALSASGYSVIDSFASVFAGTRALWLRDTRFTFSKTQILGGTTKLGVVEFVER